ncbi:PepSY-associated TM helix domain-containing protein [Aestuariibius sp. 2305UL40-4]|uniref:PepSY-associated TM helix domain-containing protein n=1 Tax=Aestuariibius violaceus TaxID=3234132 RepID=UPI00345E6626
MTDVTASAQSGATATGGAFYRLVWKWHFLAALYVLPFMALLAITGGIYLYKPQIEAWLYADRLTVPIGAEAMPHEAQVDAVAEIAGITRLRGVTDHDAIDRSTVIEFDDADGVRSIAWVDPYTAEVLAVTPRDEMVMQIVRKLHGELLLGDLGTKFVELAAHWAIVMFITGAYLWWPRGSRSWGKAFRLPRGKSRSWWRETHLFTGFLATILVVPIIITGLPWTDVWGGGLSYVQERTGQDSRSLRFGGDVPDSTESEGDPIPFADVFGIAKAEGLVAPYEMRPPTDTEGAFWIRSASIDRYNQTELIIDQYSGAVLMRHDFSDNPVVAQGISLGISFHQGELYGWVNLLQNTIAATAALVLAVSGFAAWWLRRPKGSLGVPAAPDAALGTGMIFLIIGLALLFPLMGASLMLALILDWVLFRRLGWFRAHTA